MKSRLMGSVAAVIGAWVLAGPAAWAQTPPAPSEQQFTAEQIDQLVAPIALYPDPLLSQILMAAGYPVEVVQADRWRQDPANASITPDQLTAALDSEPWDPSVKSLVPFPEVLHMMDGDLDWTESLGEAFIADPSAAMDEVQKLRRDAEASGKLASNAKQVVTDDNGYITIEPADQSRVYVPDYNPDVVYGAWPYPDYPPDYFPGYFPDCVDAEFGYCWVVWPIFVPLWGWDRWDWHGHRIDLDHDRFTRLNGGRPPPSGDIWAHNTSHRLGAPYQAQTVRGQFSAPSSSPSQERAVRGYPAADGAPKSPQTILSIPAHAPPAFESYGEGAAARSQAERGEASRASTPSYGRSAGGPVGGGGGHTGGGGGGGGGRGGGGRR